MGSLLSANASAIDRRTGKREGEHARIAIAGPRGSDAIITPSNDDDDDRMWAGVGLNNPTTKRDVRPREGLRVDRIHEKLKAGALGVRVAIVIGD